MSSYKIHLFIKDPSSKWRLIYPQTNLSLLLPQSPWVKINTAIAVAPPLLTRYGLKIRPENEGDSKSATKSNCYLLLAIFWPLEFRTSNFRFNKGRFSFLLSRECLSNHRSWDLQACFLLQSRDLIGYRDWPCPFIVSAQRPALLIQQVQGRLHKTWQHKLASIWLNNWEKTL